ncbi:MAG: hypothetical protein NC120_03380 [Ruminococcus sp.]|nr:hypothetical protein [Ruminococcus sp.]
MGNGSKGRSVFHFEDESKLTALSSENVTAADAADAGAACAGAAGGEGSKLLVSHGGGGSQSLAYAFAAGAASAGAHCFFAGNCSAAGAAYSGKTLGCDMTCHIHTEITASFGLYSRDGLTLFRAEEEAVERQLLWENRLPYSHYGKIMSFDGADGIYAAKLSSLLDRRVKGFYADVYSSSSAVLSLCENVLESINDRSGERIAFRISGDGRRISAYSEASGYIFKDKLTLICCKYLFENGSDAAVCGKPPAVLERMAKKYGRRIVSCRSAVCVNSGSPSRQCRQARRLASEQMFTSDAAALMLMTMNIMDKRGITLKEAAEELPEYADVSRYIPVNTPSELLKRLCSVPSEGTVSDTENGRVTIRPVRTGKGVMLDVESYSLESAAELCDFYTDIIRKNSR